MSDAQPDVRDGIDAFVDKWRSRWPEWRIAEVFVPAGQRERALAWAALRQELTDAAWIHSDPRPGDAKLAWWGDELLGWSRNARRHPLGGVLQRTTAPWQVLASSLPTLAATRESPRDLDEAVEGLRPFADAVCAIDAALFQSGHPPLSAITAHLLATRSAADAASAVPLALRTSPDNDGSARWARALGAFWPPATSGSVAQRIQLAVARRRFDRGDMGAPLGPGATLWTAWRAART